ncbi:MAG: hypothetical protein R2932_34105 [Caldilineaceae bacterium]
MALRVMEQHQGQQPHGLGFYDILLGLCLLRLQGHLIAIPAILLQKHQ